MQQTPAAHCAPAEQHEVAPHGTVPGAQQPPAGSGVPVQQIDPEQIWPCAQHCPPQVTPLAQHTPLTHATPPAQQVLPHGVWPGAQQPPPGLTPPVGQQTFVTGSHWWLPVVQQVLPQTNSSPPQHLPLFWLQN